MRITTTSQSAGICLALAFLLSACGGGGSDTPASSVVNPAPAVVAQPDADDPEEVVAADATLASTAAAPSTAVRTIPTPTLVVPPTALPPLAADGTLLWPVPVNASTLTLQVRPFATLPLNASGKAPRLNVLAHVNNRLFVAEEKEGKVYEVTGGTATLWFDMAAAIQSNTGRKLNSIADNAHSGLRSIAFHPAFNSNGLMYASLMEDRPADPSRHKYLSDVSTPVAGDSVLIEWKINTTTMAPITSSYREVFRVGIPVYDHPIKQIMFRPGIGTRHSDYGNLYVAHGDGSQLSVTVGGGMANDARGKILRINPLKTATANYSIPSSNPFISSTTMIPEAYSIGHRNPHHLAFSKTTGALIVAEDGRDNIDEVNIIWPGRNYGWPVREGTLVHLEGGKLYDGVAALPADDAKNSYVYPAMQFLHQGKKGDSFTGQALGGGYVVENHSPLTGYYFALDFVKSGDVFVTPLSGLRAAVRTGAPSKLRQSPIAKASILFDDDNNMSTAAKALPNLYEMTKLSPFYDNSGRVDIRFGQGPQGEMYLLSKRDRRVYLITNSMP